MADSNIDKRYENNVILTENAFKHLLQNTAILNTTSDTATTGTYYHITSSMTKQAMPVVQTISAGNPPVPGTLQIIDGTTTSPKPFLIPGWPTSGEQEIPINIGDNFVRKSGDAMTGSLTIENGANLQVTNGNVIAKKYLAMETFPNWGDVIQVGFWLDNKTNNSKAPLVQLYDITTTGAKNPNFSANKVFNAVFNDYAEYRATTSARPGQCVVDNDDGSMRVTDKRLIPGASVVSDTFGTAMGMTDECKTPLAVAGRVLVYPARNRSEYHAGMAVCASADGKVDIMTREEIRDYPDCIVGIVSEIPEYETWGSDNVKVDGRIWIKVR